MNMKRKNYSTGAPLEAKAGYSRMVSVGPFVHIGGTTSVQTDGSVYGEGNPYEQAKYILNKFVDLLKEADVAVDDVIKVKCYTTDMAYAPEIARAYSEIFFDVKPLFTMVGISMLNRKSQLVEIELEAVKADA